MTQVRGFTYSGEKDPWNIRTAGFDEQIQKLERFEEIAAVEFNQAMGHAVKVTQSQAVKNFMDHYTPRSGALLGAMYGRTISANVFSKIKGEVGVGLSAVYPFVLEVGRKPGRSGVIEGEFYLYYAPRDQWTKLNALFAQAMNRTTDKLAVE